MCCNIQQLPLSSADMDDHNKTTSPQKLLRTFYLALLSLLVSVLILLLLLLLLLFVHAAAVDFAAAVVLFVDVVVILAFLVPILAASASLGPGSPAKLRLFVVSRTQACSIVVKKDQGLQQ